MFSSLVCVETEVRNGSPIEKRRHILFKTEDNVQSQPSMNSILIQEEKN